VPPRLSNPQGPSSAPPPRFSPQTKNLAYAIINDKSPAHSQYYDQHEGARTWPSGGRTDQPVGAPSPMPPPQGVKFMTWPSRLYGFGAMDRYLDSILNLPRAFPRSPASPLPSPEPPSRPSIHPFGPFVQESLESAIGGHQDRIMGVYPHMAASRHAPPFSCTWLGEGARAWLWVRGVCVWSDPVRRGALLATNTSAALSGAKVVLLASPADHTHTIGHNQNLMRYPSHHRSHPHRRGGGEGQ